MNTAAEKTAEQIEEQAQAWIKASFSDPEGKSNWQSRFTAENMEAAFAAGVSAGIAFAKARKP